MMRNKKGQSATEFVVLTSFMLVVFFIFFFVIQQRIVDLSQQQDKEYLIEASRQVSAELDLARNTLPDYQKEFKLKSFDGQSYTITILDKLELVTKLENRNLEYVKFLKYNISGNLHHITDNASNTIYKTDGIILLPNGTRIYKPEYAGVSLNVNPERCYLAWINDTTCPSIIDNNERYWCNESFNLCG